MAPAPKASMEINVEQLLNEARQIEEDRKSLQERTLKNRGILRLLADNGALSPEVTAEVNRIYERKIRGVRMYGPNGKKLTRPVYSAMYPDLEGQPVSDEDLAALGFDVDEVHQAESEGVTEVEE